MPARDEDEAHRKAWDTRGRALRGSGSSAIQLRSDYFEKEQWYGERTFNGLSDEEIARSNILGQSGKPLTREDLADLAGAPPGSEVTISFALDEDPGATGLEVNVTFPEGSGECHRVIDTMNKTIHNQEMRVKIGKRGKGLGTAVFEGQVDAAVRHGFKTIKTMAVGDPRPGSVNGYYTWARLGFESVEPVRGPNGPIKMSELMSRPDGRAWWKAHGDGFFGEFDLSPNSISMRVFNEYRRLKSEMAA